MSRPRILLACSGEDDETAEQVCAISLPSTQRLQSQVDGLSPYRILAFQQVWDCNSPAWAGKFRDDWCRQVMRSRIEPMKKIARSLRQHCELILNYFRNEFF